jgi:hypothetical protein
MFHYRTAFGFLGAILVWGAFFAIVGAATKHPPPANLVYAIGDGIRQAFVSLIDVIRVAFTGHD